MEELEQFEGQQDAAARQIAEDINNGKIPFRYLFDNYSNPLIRKAVELSRYTYDNVSYSPSDDVESEVGSYSLFKPNSRDLMIEYPELGNIEEFAQLKNKEWLLFVWHYANKTSPLSELSKHGDEGRKRIFLALKQTKLKNELSRAKIEEILRGVFPPSVSSAIKKMESFSPSVRMRAKMITEQVFSKFEQISKTPLPKNEEKFKSVVDAHSKITEELPKVVKLLESNFGVTEKKKQDKGRAPKLMDEIIDE